MAIHFSKKEEFRHEMNKLVSCIQILAYNFYSVSRLALDNVLAH